MRGLPEGAELGSGHTVPAFESGCGERGALRPGILCRAGPHVCLPCCGPPTSPGWRRRRSPFEAAAVPVVPAQGPPGASGTGPPAASCGPHPGGPGGTGRRPPGGGEPHPLSPAPSGVWPAGTHRGRPCGESVGGVPATGESCPWAWPRQLPFRWTAEARVLWEDPRPSPPFCLPPPWGTGISQMGNGGCVPALGQPCLSPLVCKDRITTWACCRQSEGTRPPVRLLVSWE